MVSQIRNTQQLANAAETFVKALGALFPGDTFDQFFHSDTVRRAYWSALQDTIDQYTTPETAPLAHSLMNGDAFADPRVVTELLKQFLPGQAPDYPTVARFWIESLALSAKYQPRLQREAETLFNLLGRELRVSTDLRMALEQLARVRDESTTGSADEDLNRLLDAALVTGPPALNRQVLHLLALAAMREPSLGDTGLSALAQLAGYVSEDTLLVLYDRLEHINDPQRRLCMLGRLAPHLSRLDGMPDALALVQTTLDRDGARLNPALCVDVLLDLVPHLEAPRQDQALPSFQQRVLEGVQQIEDAASRVRALGALIEKLPPYLQPQAVSQAFEAAACCIPNEMARAAALSVLPPHLPPEFHERLIQIADELTVPDARALLLGRMIPYLPPGMQLQALMGALNAIEQITGDDARAHALIGLAPYIDAVGPLQHIPEGLQHAITVTFSIAQTDDRARAFAALAPYLSPELLSEALQAVKGIRDDYDRATTLAKLAPHLPADLHVAAFGIAQELMLAEARALALSTIAPYLSASARARALEDALAAALAVENRYDRVVALVDLTPHLPDDLQSRGLREALTATRSIPDEGERARALIFLAPHLTEDWLADSLADAYTIQDPLERVPVISALLPHLPDEPRTRVSQDVIALAREAKLPRHKASILAAIAPVLPNVLVQDAVQIALAIDTPYDQMHVLAVLLPRQPEHLQDTALAAAHAVPDAYQRVNALLDLVPHVQPALRYPILDEALATALAVEDDYDRASALAHLAPYVDMQSEVQNRQQDALSLALAACFNVTDAQTRTALLGRVATAWTHLLAPTQAYALWRQVVDWLRHQPYAELVADLAALAPVMQHMGGSNAIEELTDNLEHSLFTA